MILQLGVKHSIYTVSTKCCNTLLHFVSGKESNQCWRLWTHGRLYSCRDFKVPL